MRLQSSLEFLTTYSFLFLIIGVILSFLFFFATAPKAAIPNQCIAFSGPSCNIASYYVNLSQKYSLVSFSFTNPGPVPINVLNMTVIINTANSFANGCIPNVVYPGGSFTCIATMAKSPAIGSQVNGYYSYNALYCNSAIANLQNNCTSGINLQYGGSFSTTTSSTKPLIFSVLASISPTNQQLPPFQTNPTAIPAGYFRTQSGFWSTVTGGFGFGSLAYIGQTQLGYKIAPFTVSTSILGSNSVSCSGSYNSLLSEAYTAIYVPQGITATPGVTVYANNAFEFYYAPKSMSWNSVFGGGAWVSTGTPRQYGPSTITVGSGINYLAVLWDHTCGPGVQVVSVSGLPATMSTTTVTTTTISSTTTSTSTTSTSTTSTSTTSTSTTSTSTTSINYLYGIGGGSKDYYSQLYGAGGLSTWSSTATYPLPTPYGYSCTAYNTYIYCIGYANGGQPPASTSYYASLSSSGTSAWSLTTAYPLPIGAQSCVSYSGYIYCVAGYTTSAFALNNVYSAPISSSGIGSWTATTPYPMNVIYFGCNPYNGDIYCVGGGIAYPGDTNNVYYASLSSGTVGTWSATNSYPLLVEYNSCVPYNGYIYCVGGARQDGSAVYNNVYYASISSSGIGSWTSTNSYPLQDYGLGCNQYGGYIYCTSGYSGGYVTNVYYAPIYGSGGLGAWVSTNSIPGTLPASQSTVTYS